MPSEPQPTEIRLSLLGGFRLCDHAGRDIHLPTKKAAILLALVATEADARISREKLCRTLWPDSDDPQAKNSLRQVLSNLRKALNNGGTSVLDADTRHVWINSPSKYVDVVSFNELLVSTDQMDFVRAANLFQGEFLDGFAVLPDLEGWLRDQRSTLLRDAAELAEALSNQTVAAPASLTTACRELSGRLLAIDPTVEAAHRAIIRAHKATGNTTEARKQFDACKKAVFAAFQAEPEPLTRALLNEQNTRGSPKPLNLRTTVTPATTNQMTDGRPSLVVLPFDDLSGEQGDFFAEGVVEEITSSLSRGRDFFVIARQTALFYKNRVVPMEEIGSQLGVAYAVEGSLKRSGSLLRLHVHLVDTATSRQIWSDRFDGSVDDVFSLQDKIACEVAMAISPSIRSEEINRAKSVPIENREVYELVLAGFPGLWAQTREGNQKARALFERALEIAPGCGRAGALLAWCHAQDVTYIWSDDPVASQNLCTQCLDRAIPRIQSDPTALAAAGAAMGQGEGDLEKAHRLLEQAIGVDPNNSWAWARLAWNHFFAGRYFEAREGFQTAKKLSPLDPMGFNIENGLAGVLFVEGRFAEAAEVSRQNFESNKSRTWSLRQFAAYSALAGEIDSAKEAMTQYLADHPDATITSNRKFHPQRNNAHYMALFTEGLRLAGMAEG